jgi:hypothetical protein
MLQRSAFPTLGGRPVAEIRKSEIINLLDKLADGELRDHKGKKIAGGPVAADRLLAVLRKVGTRAVKTISGPRSLPA